MLVLCVLSASLEVLGQVAPRSTTTTTPPKPANRPRHATGSRRQPRRPRTDAGISRGAGSEQSDRFADLGDQFSDKDRSHAAEAAYKEAINLSPNNADAYAGLGALYNDLGRHSEALPLLNKARAGDSSNVWVIYELGYAYLGTERYNEAIEKFKQAISAQPDFAQAYFGLGLTYLEQSNKPAALSQYEKIKEFDAVMAQELLTEINKK